ncbi:hypothetical protein IMZ68_01445 [Candidatus Bathyarchaeota archaeon]|nr:hypothetical protein [Candidatus Bathyarchaeota archaeon]
MKKVLFVCVENAGRSQMAEAFAKNTEKTSLWFPAPVTNRPIRLTPWWWKP